MLVLVLSLLLTAIQPQLSFTRYTAEEGFPQLPIFGIAQDSRGRIIISSGPSDLFSFDGYDLVRTGHSDNLSGFFTSSDGELYAMTRKGVFRLKADGVPECASPVTAHSMVELPERGVYCVSKGEITSLDGRAAVAIPEEYPTYCASASSDAIILGTYDGKIVRYSFSSDRFEEELDTGARINVILPSGDGDFWIGTRGKGLFLWSPDEGLKTQISSGLCSANVLSLCLDTGSVLWVGTLKGLNLVSGGKVTGTYQNETGIGASLSHNTVRRIFRDNQGGMWLGTYFGGINYWHPSRRAVTNLFQGNGEGSLNDNVTSCISESSDGKLWIGTNQGGVNCYDPTVGKVIRQYNVAGLDGGALRFNDVKTVWHHPDGRRVYIGAYGAGLNLLDRQTGTLKRLPSPSTAQSIVPISEGRIVFCASRGEVYIYDLKTCESRLVCRLKCDFLFKSSSGEIYAGDRLSRLVCDGDSFRFVPTVGQEHLECICEDKDSQTLYYATKDSLFRFSVGSSVSEAIHLPQNFPDIVGLESYRGKLWITTVGGLFSLSLARGRLTRYSVRDGLATDFFITFSHAVTSDGKLCFGGAGGLSIIDPDLLGAGSECPLPFVSKVTVSGKPSSFCRDSVKVLHHPDNNIAIHFSATDYCATGTNVFEYRLNGFDVSWQRAGSERLASYSNLPRGNYTLQLRVSKKGEDWTCDESALRLRVYPAWYASAAALCLWLILGLAVLYLMHRQQARRKEQENKLAMFEMEKKYSREISKLKVLKVLNSDIHAGKAPVSEISRDDEVFLSRVLSLVEENIGNPEYSTDSLASSLGMSRSTLHKHMVGATGSSALAFIHGVRFSKACELLEKGGLTVSEICYKTGFSSPAYFSASFRKRMGCSPQEYSRRPR